MNILPDNTYLFLSFIIFQGFLVVVVVFFFIDRIISSRKNRLEQQLIREQAYLESKKILDNANKLASDEINSAHTKASEIVKQAEFLSSATQQTAQEAFSSLVQKQETRFSQILDAFAKDMSASFEKEKISTLAEYSEAVSDVKKDILGHIQIYRETLSHNLQNIDKDIQDKIASSFQDSLAKIEAYEDSSMKKIDTRIFDILKAVSVGVLGEAISLDDEEEFIIKSLKDAAVYEKLRQQ